MSVHPRFSVGFVLVVVGLILSVQCFVMFHLAIVFPWNDGFWLLFDMFALFSPYLTEYSLEDTLLKSILSTGYKWRDIELAIRFWFKADHCFPILSFDGLVRYIVFKLYLAPSTLLYGNNIIHTTTFAVQITNIFCLKIKVRTKVNVLYFTTTLVIQLYASVSMGKSTVWPHDFSKRRCVLS